MLINLSILFILVECVLSAILAHGHKRLPLAAGARAREILAQTDSCSSERTAWAACWWEPGQSTSVHASMLISTLYNIILKDILCNKNQKNYIAHLADLQLCAENRISVFLY